MGGVRGRESGAGTVLAAGLALAMLLLLAVLVGLGQAVTAAAKAGKAADLAALAAADAFRGITPGDACKIAAEVASRNGAQLRSCAPSGDDSVQLAVTVRSTLPWPAVAEARAGPPPDRPVEHG